MDKQTDQRATFWCSLIHFFQKIKPIDISGEAEIYEQGLPGDYDDLDEPVITDLGPVRRFPSLPRGPRLTARQRILAGATVVVVLLSMLAGKLLILPRFAVSQVVPNAPRVLFQAQDLGSLSLPAWGAGVMSVGWVANCGVSRPASTPPTNTTPLLPGCTPVSIGPVDEKLQHLSFVDGKGNLYGWDRQNGRLAKKIVLRPGSVPESGASSWRWLYPGRYILSTEEKAGSPPVSKIWDVMQGRLLFTLDASLPFALTSFGNLAVLTAQHTVQILRQQVLWQQGSSQGLSDTPFVEQTLSSPSFAHLIALSWSPNFSQLATLSSDGTLQIWDTLLRPAALLQTLHVASSLSPLPPNALPLSWAPDEQRLAVCVPNSIGAAPVEIWDIGNGHLLQKKTVLSSYLTTMTWLDNGREMLSGNDHEVLLWNTATGQTRLSLQPQPMAFLSQDETLQVTGDGRLLILPQLDGLHMIDLQSGKLLRTLRGEDQGDNRNYLLDLALSPDNTHLAVVDTRGQVQIWNIQNGQETTSYELPASFNTQIANILVDQGSFSQKPANLAWSSDGAMLAVTYQGGGLVVLGALPS